MKRYLISVLVPVFVVILGASVGCSSQPQFLKANGQPVELVNSEIAYDHTWEEVKAFLERDNTDEERYTPERGSGYFAEMLHNRAEYYGFRTAFVVVDFEAEEQYALNAFNTIDYGLVYVDCAHKWWLPPPLTFTIHIFMVEWAPVEHWDKVAYIQEGKKMGFISAGFTENDFRYQHYEHCSGVLADFWQESAERDAQLQALVDELIRSQKRTEELEEEIKTTKQELHQLEMLVISSGGSTPEQQRIERKLQQDLELFTNELEATDARCSDLFFKGSWGKAALESDWEDVRGYSWKESGSPVTRIRIYW